MANEHARNRRKNQTTSEGLLWSILRGSQVAGLKFRREHPIGPWIVDFACVAKNLVVEIDGGYHEYTEQQDCKRQADLTNHGWNVVRFTAEQVEGDAEAVARVIANAAGVEFCFLGRLRTGSGQFSIHAKKPKSRMRVRSGEDPPLADARPSQGEG